jgi:hypothetical protein
MALQAPEPSASRSQFQYHLWFNLKPDASESEALRAARSFLAQQLASGQIAAFRLLRNTSESANTLLPRHLALIDFTDREHFSAAFSDLRRDGIYHGSHGELMRMVSDFRVEFTETPE